MSKGMAGCLSDGNAFCWKEVMENKRGRNWRARYLTIEAFEKWKGQDFCHLVKDVKLNRKLLLIILAATIALPTIFLVAIVQLLG